MLISLLVIQFYGVAAIAMDTDDEIDFFNIGQGHAVLVHQNGSDPLLIDAGSSLCHYEVGQKHDWEKGNLGSAVAKISKRVIDFWKRSTSQNYHLDVIITHPDDDHKNFLFSIFRELEGSLLSSSVLLGGPETMYGDVLSIFSGTDPNRFKIYCSGNIFGSFSVSDIFPRNRCITHLFCPPVQGSDTNSWSIITRVQLHNISAMLTGDADAGVKQKMLFSVTDHQQLKSDILLVPHHGAENTYYEPWDKLVDPKAIIIGSAPQGGVKGDKKKGLGYRHPRGTTILDFLTFDNRRLWGNNVQDHAILYWSEKDVHQKIKEKIIKRSDGLFDDISENREGGQWHLAWIDLPIYTLWTTGSLYFTGNVNSPHFIEAPNGLMPYIATRNFEQGLSPVRRKQITNIDQGQRLRIHTIINKIVEEETIANWYTQQLPLLLNPFLLLTEEEAQQRLAIPDDMKEIYKNLLTNEMLSTVLSVKLEDRDLFIDVFDQIFQTTEKKLQLHSSFFQFLQGAVIDRNLHKDPDGVRLKKAVQYLFRENQQEEQDLETVIEESYNFLRDGQEIEVDDWELKEATQTLFDCNEEELDLWLEMRKIAKNTYEEAAEETPQNSFLSQNNLKTSFLPSEDSESSFSSIDESETSSMSSEDSFEIKVKNDLLRLTENAIDLDNFFIFELDYKTLILKTFSKTFDDVDKLKDYTILYKNMALCGPSPHEIDALCPGGLSDWKKFAQFMKFYRKEIDGHKGNTVDVEKVMALRKEGKNFKEISKAYIMSQSISNFCTWWRLGKDNDKFEQKSN